jgi:DNA-binding transcriptional LysR family regulator
MSLSALGHESSEVYGLLRVTAPADVGTQPIAPLLPAFLSRYPRVRIDIEHPLRVVDLAREGVDLAVRLTWRVSITTRAVLALAIFST